jgi:hypothetical protein
MRKLVVSLALSVLALGSLASLGCAVESPRFIPPGEGDEAPTGSSTATPTNGTGTTGGDAGTAADSAPALPALPQYSLLLDGTCTGGDCDALVDCLSPSGGGSTLVGSKCFSSDGQCKGPGSATTPRNVYGCYETGIALWALDSKCGGSGTDPNAGGACAETAGIAPCDVAAGTADVAGTVCVQAGKRCTLNQVIYACLPSATTNALSELCDDQTAGNCAGLGLCAATAPGGAACAIEGKRCVVADDLPTAGATSTAGRAYTCIRR